MYWIDFCLNAQGTRGHSDFCSSHCLVSMAILWLLWVGHTAKITVPLSASSRTKNYGYQFLFFMNVTEFWVFIFSMQHTILIFSIPYSNNIYLWMWSLCFRFIFSKIIYINLKKKCLQVRVGVHMICSAIVVGVAILTVVMRCSWQFKYIYLNRSFKHLSNIWQ